MARSRIDHRRLKRSRTYTVPEAAQALRVTIGTVRRWVREGLPQIDDKRPYLIHGQVMHDWLGIRFEARKVKCGPRQIFCCKCQNARDMVPGSAVIIHRNEKTASVRALCAECGTVMFRHCSKASADNWLNVQRPLVRQPFTLIASSNTRPNEHFKASDESDPEREGGIVESCSRSGGHRR